MFRVLLCVILFVMGPAAVAADYLDVVLGDGAIGYWTFCEDTGNFYDEVSGTFSGVRGETTAMIAGPQGTGLEPGNPAIQTGGETGFVHVVDAGGGDVTFDFLLDDWTMEAWVKPPVEGWNGAQAVIGKLLPSYIGYSLTVLDRSDDGTLETSAFIRTGAGGWYQSVNTPWAVFGNSADEQWHHLVASFDRSVGGKMYADGVLISEVESTVTDGVYINTNEYLNFGQKAAFAPDYYYGGIDEVALYRTALTAEQVAAHYAAAGLPDPVVPEPETLVLLLAGAVGLFAWKCWKLGKGKR